MEKMYKAELTEEEAKMIGERRWRRGVKRQALKWILIAFGIAMVFVVLTIVFTGIPSLVFALLTVLVVVIAFLFFFRYDRIATEAGKAFAQSLKEKK